MTYLSDRNRREYLYLMYLIKVTYEGAVIPPDGADDAVKARIEESLEEIIDKVKHHKDMRCIHRLLSCTIKRMANHEVSGEKIVITTYCFLELLAQRGIIQFTESSALAEVVEWILASVDVDSPVTQKRLKNGNKEAALWLNNLQKEGYFNE